MTAENFCYWLQGYFEIGEKGPKSPERPTLTAEQTEDIKIHLGYVFKTKELKEQPRMWIGPHGPTTEDPSKAYAGHPTRDAGLKGTIESMGIATC